MTRGLNRPIRPGDLLPPIHPGEILREIYLEPLNMSAGALAKALHVPRTRIERLVTEQTSVTPDTALRLGKFFKTSAELWLGMQTSYDLKIARRDKQAEIEKITELDAATHEAA
ncbi:HigA family addiction module antitoxin [Phyllobacterium zundukense]|jgi:antitoxin HigA-1|uniref:HigA family addiction module antitoxin n=1 Tax=Phyllobacterium zundukense TaxID=1867719 RepID=A0ACD4D6U7_9HYPH|nr:HigA family addiction module antitoxin [Phyllobacterium zundukense]UXN61613.1 HigA family addiction module antitoxin [Phyllobacterium zundukense]